MKGLLLFALESAEHGFDSRIEEILTEDQNNHKAFYHIEKIRVRIGAEEDGLIVPKGAYKGCDWNVRTNKNGDMQDFETQNDLSYQLATLLYGRIIKNDDSACSAVFISNGDPKCSKSVIQLSLLISRHLCKLYPVKIHNFILQDQHTFKNPDVAKLMMQIVMSNQRKPTYFTAQYMLPWEDTEEVRENSRQTIIALIKTMMMTNADPMMLARVIQPMWIETATIRRLQSPIERIRNEIFKYITNDFSESILLPAINQDGAATVPPKEITDCVKRLENYVRQIERETLLPTMDDLMCIMPLKNPPALTKFETDLTPEMAWSAIEKIYASQDYDRLKRMLNPSLEELSNQYKELSKLLSSELLKQVIQLCKMSNQEFSTVPVLLKQIGDQLITMKERALGQETHVEFDKGIFAFKEKREAIQMAKTRHLYLEKVYKAASRRLTENKKKFREEIMADAVSIAKQFLKNCLTRLNAEYKQMCSIYLSRPVEKNCYDHDLESAYEYWCRHTDAIDPFSPYDLYEFFTENVFQLSAEKAAQTVCEALSARLEKNTNDAVESIRVNIDSFFPELSFRSELLAKQGLNGDFNVSLLDYLNGQTTHSPLLYQERAGNPISIQAKALILHQETGADEFSNLAENSGITVVNDPHEKGVQLVVKYAGNALDDVLVYKGNMKMEGRN